MGYFRKICFPLSLRNLALFAFIWLLVGFTLGTATLLGPVRWVTLLRQAQGWSQGFEDWLVRGVMLIFVLVSCVLALWLARLVVRTGDAHARWGIPLASMLSAAAMLLLWLNPELMGNQMGTPSQVHGHFTFGPYPTLEMMQQLKQEHYTAIISLLHPAVVPFEPKLLAEEKEYARQVGIQLIHLPMLPWVSKNMSALDSLKRIARQGKGRYYVHCYLGKDRVGLARRVIQSIVSEKQVAVAAPTVRSRRIEEYPDWERGRVVILADRVYLTPYPTDEEFLAFILSGDVAAVVNLMNPAHPPDTSWINKERVLLQRHGIAFHNLPIVLFPFNPLEVLKTVHRLWLLPRPLVIHGFRGAGPRWEGIVQAFRTNLPPLPPSLFNEPLARGPVAVIAPNIAVGPRPLPREFGGFLFQRGVRKFIYLGSASDSAAVTDRQICQMVHLRWQAFEPYAVNLMDSLARGGPYYLYGPFVQYLREGLARRFGPAIPDTIRFDAAHFVDQLKTRQSAASPSVDGKDRPKLQPKAASLGRLQHFFLNAFPDVRMMLLYTPLFLLYTFLAATFAGWLRIQKKVRTPYTRKVFHLFIFTMASLLQFTLGLSGVVLFGSIVSLAVLYAVYRGDGFAFYEAMARPTDAPHRILFIVIPLITTALGGVTANLFFPKYAYIGYLVGGWGDAVGEPVGTRWGGHKYRVPSLAGVYATRSLEGSLAVALVSTFVTTLGLAAAGLPFRSVLYTAALCGVASALVEAVSNHGLDNFTIQVTAAAVVSLILG